MIKKYRFILLFLGGFGFAFRGLGLSAQSEPLTVRPDGTTQTTLVGGMSCTADCTILGSSRLADGLFHSFSEFSIPAGVTVTFADGGANNIFARVSSAASTIEGTLAVAGSGQANFFLINPWGVTFGAQSALVSPGSFVISTADSVMFSNGARFGATESTLPMLMVSTPIGLQFGDRPGPIINRSQASPAIARNVLGEPAGLRVNAEETLALVGGSVALENGNLTASSGQIEVGSVAANSQVSLSPKLTLGYAGTSTFEDIQFTGRAVIDASGEGGRIAMHGRSITMAEQSSVVNFSLGPASTGSISLSASDFVAITGTGILFSAFVGNGASLDIATRQLTVEAGALISGGTLGAGSGGALTINASEQVSLRGTGPFSPSLITTSTEGSGAGGNLTINTHRLNVSDGAQIQAVTYGSGAGGSLAINADQLNISDGAGVSVDSFGGGDSGNLAVRARSLRLDNGARVTATAAFSDGGNIQLEDLEALVLRRGSLISAQAGMGDGTGNGGNITIKSDFIVASLLGNSDIIARAAQGRGGNIIIETKGLYGIAERRAIAGNRTNDIDASSEFGISGTIAVNQLPTDVDQTLIELPGQVLESDADVVQGCQAKGNRFVITGRGGLPAAPTEAVEITSPLVDLGESRSRSFSALDQLEPASSALLPNSDTPASYQLENQAEPSQWTEASGWTTDDQNQIVLTVPPQRAENDLGQTVAQCAR